jgi:putative MATE family efflux protein
MFKDKEYLGALFRTALPIAVQNFVSSSLNAVGVLLIGQLGEQSVAGVGLANQIFFLLSLMLFGICSGSAIYTAQYWGSHDLASIRKVVGLCLGMALAAGGLFTVVALFFPAEAMRLYSTDPVVVELGSQYLVIIGFSYIATAISFTYMSQLRATGNVSAPMAVSVVSLGLGTALNYALIFGLFGLPVMGVRGAALGTCLARLLECGAMVTVTYCYKLPTAMRLVDLRGITSAFFKRFMVTVLPVAANETIWSMGITIYNMVYAHIGTEAIAAVNITSTIESMVMVVYIGLANASAILIGNRIGAGEESKAYLYARRSLTLVMGMAVLGGLAMIVFAAPILTAYKISELAAANARGVLTVLGCAACLRAANMMLIIGILRSGGDTRFSLVLDVGTVWLVGIPMALLGAVVFQLPVYWVVAMVMGDEVAKFIGGMIRFRSRKWINNLVRAVA